MAQGIKTGGRAKGTVNRTTSETKQILQNVVGNELDKISTLMDKLEPKERIDAIIKLLPYIIPKQTEITIEPKELKHEPITVTLIEK